MDANISHCSQQVQSGSLWFLRRNVATYRLLAVLVAAALACNFPRPTPQPASMPSEQGTPAEAVTPQPAPPMSFYDLYAANVKAGVWTEGQGLVQMFGYFTGEIPAADVIAGQDVMPDNIDTLMAIAQNYVAAHPEAPENAEIQRRMNLLVPDADRLLPYSEEIKDLSRIGGAKLARPPFEPNRTEVECDEIWANGIPTPAAGGAPICFDFLKFTASGVPFRIFIERNWLGQDAQARLSLIKLAKEGLSDAAATYREYAVTGLLPTDVIFNQLAARDPMTNQEILANMGSLPAFGEVCRVGIFPASFSLGDAFFKQDVAHEMFHCFQGNNLLNFAGANIPAILWWLEGTAEYWSNVVYPDVNEEHNRTGHLDDIIQTTPLFQMAYPNFLFFQHMANKFGNRPELVLLSQLPNDGDESAFATALNAALPGDSADFYLSFGQGYLDASIPDTGSVKAPVRPHAGIPVSMDTVNSYEAVAHPYQLNWIQLTFPKKLVYVVRVSEDGNGRYAVRPDGYTGTWWEQLPSEVDTSCGELDYTVLLTNVQPASDYYFKVTVEDRKPKEACETPVPVAGDCLLGKWELLTDSYAPYVQSIVSHSQIAAHLDSATIQSATFSFDGNTGISTQTLVDDVVTLTQKGGGTIDRETDVFTPDVQIVVGVSGTVTPTFEHTVDAKTGVGMIIYKPGGGTLTIRVSVNGEETPVTTQNARDLSYMSSERATYVCSGDTLIYTPDRGVSVEPLRFMRVSAAP